MTVEGIAQHIHEVFQKTWARCIQKAGQKRFRCFGQSFSDELAANYCDEVSIGGYQFTPQNLQKPRGFFFRFAAWRFNIRAYFQFKERKAAGDEQARVLQGQLLGILTQAQESTGIEAKRPFRLRWLQFFGSWDKIAYLASQELLNAVQRSEASDAKPYVQAALAHIQSMEGQEKKDKKRLFFMQRIGEYFSTALTRVIQKNPRDICLERNSSAEAGRPVLAPPYPPEPDGCHLHSLKEPLLQSGQSPWFENHRASDSVLGDCRQTAPSAAESSRTAVPPSAAVEPPKPFAAEAELPPAASPGLLEERISDDQKVARDAALQAELNDYLARRGITFPLIEDKEAQQRNDFQNYEKMAPALKAYLRYEEMIPEKKTELSEQAVVLLKNIRKLLFFRYHPDKDRGEAAENRNKNFTVWLERAKVPTTEALENDCDWFAVRFAYYALQREGLTKLREEVDTLGVQMKQERARMQAESARSDREHQERLRELEEALAQADLAAKAAATQAQREAEEALAQADLAAKAAAAQAQREAEEALAQAAKSGAQARCEQEERLAHAVAETASIQAQIEGQTKIDLSAMIEDIFASAEPCGLSSFGVLSRPVQTLFFSPSEAAVPDGGEPFPPAALYDLD